MKRDHFLYWAYIGLSLVEVNLIVKTFERKNT